MKYVMVFLMLASMALGYTSAFDIPWGSQSTYSNLQSNMLRKWAEGIDGRVSAAVGTGNIYYVDSNVTTEGDGSSWVNAKNTLAEAIALCTASNGDVIYVAQGHAETWSTTALDADLNIAGVTIVGCGSGTLKPTFTITHVDATMTVSAINCAIINCRFTANVDDTKVLMTLSATSDGAIIKNCEFRDSAANKDFLVGISVAAAGDGVTLYGNDFRTTAAATTNNAILSAAVTDLNIVGNVIFGKFATGAVLTSGVLTRSVIAQNIIINAEAAIAIALNGTTSTGVLAGNFLTGTTSQAAALTGDNAMFCFENYINDTAGSSGLLNPAVDS